MTAERITIKESKDFCYYGEFYGSIDKIISTLQRCKEKGWEGIDYDYDYGNGGKDYYVYKTRLENDEEYEKRIKQEEQRKENRRKQYEQLKKEFGEDT